MTTVKWNITETGDNFVRPVTMNNPTENVVLWKITNNSENAVKIHDGLGDEITDLLLPRMSSLIFALAGSVVITLTAGSEANGKIKFISRVA